MAKVQKINFTLSQTSDGRLKINMAMYPKMAKNEREFRKLPIRQQEMLSAAARIGNHVMKALAEEEKNNGRNRKNML